METILITGGAGFIGSNAAAYFLEKGYKVIIFDNFLREGSKDNMRWLKNHSKAGNLNQQWISTNDLSGFNYAITQVDLVIHLASQVAVTSSVQDPLFDFKVNALGTLNLLEALRTSPNKPPLIYTSTNKVYGELEGVDVKEKDTRYEYINCPNGIDEKQNLDFHSPYGCSKGTADQYVRDYARIYGLKTVVFRNSCIYGVHQFGTTDQGWLAYFAKGALSGTPIVIYGDGKQVRDALFISDMIRAFDLAFQNIEKTKGKIYNMGGGIEHSVSILELIALLGDITETKISYTFSDWRPGDQKVYISNTTKAQEDFGWKPTVSIEEGLVFMINWMKSNQ